MTAIPWSTAAVMIAGIAAFAYVFYLLEKSSRPGPRR